MITERKTVNLSSNKKWNGEYREHNYSESKNTINLHEMKAGFFRGFFNAYVSGTVKKKIKEENRPE